MVQQLSIDKEILEQAVSVSGIKNYSVIVDESIRLFISLNSQKKIEELRGKVTWDADLDKLRELRDGND